jgi:hypothetical protein
MKQFFNKIVLLTLVIFGISNQPMITGEPGLTTIETYVPDQTEQPSPLAKLEMQEDQPWDTRLRTSLSDTGNQLWSKAETKNSDLTKEIYPESFPPERHERHVTFQLPDPTTIPADHKRSLSETWFSKTLKQRKVSAQEFASELEKTDINDIKTFTPDTSKKLLSVFLQDPQILKALQTEPEKFEALYKNLKPYPLKIKLLKSLPADSRLQKIPNNLISIMAPELSPDQLLSLSSDQLESIHENYPNNEEFAAILKLRSRGWKNAWRSKDIKNTFKNNTEILADYLTTESGKTVEDKFNFMQSAINELSVSDQETLFRKIVEADLLKQLDRDTLKMYFNKMPKNAFKQIEDEIIVQKQFKAYRAQAQTKAKQRQEQESVRKHIEENLENYLKTYHDNLGKPAAERTKLINEEYAKKALAKLTPAQRAQLLTNIARDEISRTDNGYAQTAKIFENVRDALSPLLPPDEIPLIQHDGKNVIHYDTQTMSQGSLDSYHFKILDMTNFTYDPMVDMKINAMRLNDRQNLHIQNPDMIARAMLKYFTDKYPSKRDPQQIAQYLASNDLLTKNFATASTAEIEAMKTQMQIARFSNQELDRLLNKSFKDKQDLSSESMQKFLAAYQQIMPDNIILASHSGTVDQNGKPLPGSTITVYNLKDDHFALLLGVPKKMVQFLSSMSPASIAELPKEIFTDKNIQSGLLQARIILNSHFNTAQRAAIIAKFPEKIQNSWLNMLKKSTYPKLRVEAEKIEDLLNKKVPGFVKKMTIE